ncbi:EAL domain-containing protein [Brucella pituitosa]|uniref:EAL domain-containing protein n=1 Tax=Brucella pituitosa TaxID=571256 RepID=UPI0014781209|nr:EAL domain-containing protein [Brucella pituitosa]
MIDNLPSIEAAYSEGMAVRTLFEVWRRIDSFFGSEIETSEIEPWGITLHFTDEHGFSFVRRLEDLLSYISTTPVGVGKNKLIVAVSIRSSRSDESLGSAKLDVEQYLEDMRTAIAAYSSLSDGKIIFAEQNIVSVNQSHAPLYKECLVRIEDADGNVIMPGAFLPAVERLGLMRPIDRQVVRSVMDELRRRPDVILGCNVSGMSVSNDLWWHSILRDLRHDPQLARRLVIEITETLLPPNLDSALELVTALRATGCRVAVDDFGAGYSTIAFARSASPDIVKVDGSFMRELNTGLSRPDLLEHLVMLASHFAPHVVVEGVETEADFLVAKRSGANWCQGYLFTPPALLGVRNKQVNTTLISRKLSEMKMID